MNSPTGIYNTGGFTIDGDAQGTCECYRLDITYEDGCNGGEVTDTYYWKIGNNCPNFAPPSPIGSSFKSKSGSENNFSITPNPTSQDISLQVEDQYVGSEATINIISMDGKVVYQKTVTLTVSQELLLPQEKGTYMYTVQTNGKVFSGKFIKM